MSMKRKFILIIGIIFILALLFVVGTFVKLIFFDYSNELISDGKVKENDEETLLVDIAEIDDINDPQPKEKKDDEADNLGSKVEISSSKEAIGEYETSGVTVGIDVSKWQGDINWTALKKAGIDFAIIRTGYRTLSDGKIYEDPYAKYNMQQAQEAGVMIGVYFYSTAKNEEEARQEANFVCKLIAKYRITYPVAFDYEGYRNSENRNYGLSSEERTKIAKTFLEYVENKDYTPCFYASKSALENDFIVDSLGSCKIWVSQFPAISYPETKKSSYLGEHHMWQYTGSGTVQGINGIVDVNIAYFNYSQEAAAKDPEEPDKVSLKSDNGIYFQEVYEKVTPKIEVNLRSTPSLDNDSNIVAKVKNQEVLIRTGISESTNWSRVYYKGKNLYVASDKVMKDLDDTSQVDAISRMELSENGLYQIVNETITAKDIVNLRKQATSTSEKVGELKNGGTLKRVGIGSNGWSKLIYNGNYVYASSILITTDMSYKSEEVPDVIYKEVNEQVTAKIETNLRSEPSSNGKLLKTLIHGEYITRIGIGTNSWSKLRDADGTIMYAATNLLEVKE